MGLLHKLLTKSKIVREDVLHVASCEDSTLNISKRHAVTSYIDSPSGFLYYLYLPVPYMFGTFCSQVPGNISGNRRSTPGSNFFSNWKLRVR